MDEKDLVDKVIVESIDLYFDLIQVPKTVKLSGISPKEKPFNKFKNLSDKIVSLKESLLKSEEGFKKFKKQIKQESLSNREIPKLQMHQKLSSNLSEI